MIKTRTSKKAIWLDGNTCFFNSWIIQPSLLLIKTEKNIKQNNRENAEKKEITNNDYIKRKNTTTTKMHAKLHYECNQHSNVKQYIQNEKECVRAVSTYDAILFMNPFHLLLPLVLLCFTCRRDKSSKISYLCVCIETQ